MQIQHFMIKKTEFLAPDSVLKLIYAFFSWISLQA